MSCLQVKDMPGGGKSKWLYLKSIIVGNANVLLTVTDLIGEMLTEIQSEKMKEIV